MQRAYHPAFAREVNYEFMRLPEDPDGQVRETIRHILGYVRADANSWPVQACAQRVLELGAGDPVRGLWALIKGRMRFQHDEDTANQLRVNDARIPSTIEVVIRPYDQAVLVLTRGGVEDCDGFEGFAASVLTALEVPCSLVTVAADEDEPGRYSHVYLAAYPQGYGGPRLPIDFSHGPYPGWECPNLGRLREWPVEAGWSERTAGVWAAGVTAALYLLVRLYVQKGRPA